MQILVFLNGYHGRDGSVCSGEFLAAMLIAEDLVDEEVCKVYLDKFRKVDKTGDGKLDRDDLAELANEERSRSSNTQTPAAHNPLQPMSPAEEYPVIIPESFSTSVPGRESYVANAEQEKVDNAIIDHAKQGGNLQHVMQSDRLAKIQAVFRAMDDDLSGEITVSDLSVCNNTHFYRLSLVSRTRLMKCWTSLKYTKAIQIFRGDDVRTC